MTSHTDDEDADEREAREHLIDAEAEAQETLDEAEQLHEEAAEPREDEPDDDSS